MLGLLLKMCVPASLVSLWRANELQGSTSCLLLGFVSFASPETEMSPQMPAVEIALKKNLGPVNILVLCSNKW